MNLQGSTPNPYLTLSARPELAQDDAEGPTAPRTAALITREAFIRAGGCPHCWPFDVPPAVTLERDPPIITESELRLLDGNR